MIDMSYSYLLFKIPRHPPISPLFPYTTLFRSDDGTDGAEWPLERPSRPAGRAGGAPLQHGRAARQPHGPPGDRESTRLNSSHVANSYAVFCLKKKKDQNTTPVKILTLLTNSMI